jgi:hypothetical protein
MATGHSMDATRWQVMFDQAMARIAVRFHRAEPRATARAFVLGLLSGVERKNCRQLAEEAGHAHPGAMQRLLRSARWDADGVRDEVRQARSSDHRPHRRATFGLVNLAQAPPGTGQTRPLPTTAHQPLGHLDREATVEY